MTVRKIVHIDAEKCDGCGLCIPNCAEGAIQIIDGKAKLLADQYCDGLGACLGHCPQDAITIIEREAVEFDEGAVEELLTQLAEQKKPDSQCGCSGGPATPPPHRPGHHGCPGSKMMKLAREEGSDTLAEPVHSGDVSISIKPQLTHWPVQLNLVSPEAPYFQNAHLLVTADCVPVAYPNYHLELLKGKSVVIGCPKLDDLQHYVNKLTALIKHNNLKSITIAHMEVPCCSGIIWAVKEAVKNAGVSVPVETVEITVGGEKK